MHQYPKNAARIQFPPPGMTGTGTEVGIARFGLRRSAKSIEPKEAAGALRREVLGRDTGRNLDPDHRPCTF